MKMLPSCRCVSAEGLGNCDKWHFDLSATRTLGERYYEAWRELTGACAQGDCGSGAVDIFGRLN